MCQVCGCAIDRAGEPVVLEVLEGLLAANDRTADHNRAHFDEHGVFVVNLMSSPGAGKTALLEATIVALRHRYRIAVIEGDLETDNDAVRIRAHGVPALQITTGTACHLDANLVHQALHALPLAGIDLLFIENVGNLVCPAAFDLGEAHKVVVLSVTEGEDRPLKYPDMFAAADLMLLNKSDLLPHLDLDMAACLAAARHANPQIEILQVSARTGDGLAAFYDWIEGSLPY